MESVRMNIPRGLGTRSRTKIQTPEVCMTEVFMVLIVTMGDPERTWLPRDTSIYS